MTGRYLSLCAAGLLCASYVLLFAGMFGVGAWILQPDGRFRGSDFFPLYTAGSLALQGQAAVAYDFESLRAAQVALGGEFRRYGGWFNPPTFLFVTAPLALLPYVTAFFVWLAVSFAVFAAGLWVVRPGWGTILAGFAAPATFVCVWFGQNGFLTAGLLGLWLGLVDRRPWLAGVFLGLLTYKPQFGLAFPIVLMASGRWRTFLVAAGTALALAAAAGAVFGLEAWRAFPDAVGGAARRYMGQEPETLMSVYGTVMLLIGREGPALMLHAAVAVAATVLAALIWRSDAGTAEARAASAMAAGFLGSPYSFAYDAVALATAAAFLLRTERPWGQKLAILLALALPGVSLASPLPFLVPIAWGLILGVAATDVARDARRSARGEAGRCLTASPP